MVRNRLLLTLVVAFCVLCLLFSPVSATVFDYTNTYDVKPTFVKVGRTSTNYFSNWAEGTISSTIASNYPVYGSNGIDVYIDVGSTANSYNTETLWSAYTNRSESNYFAFTLIDRTGSYPSSNVYVQLVVYPTTSNTVSGNTGNIISLLNTYHNNDRYEMIRYSNTIYLYINGVLVNTGSSCTSTPTTFGFRAYGHGQMVVGHLYLDDIIIGDSYESGNVVSIPNDWYLYKPTVGSSWGLIDSSGNFRYSDRMYTRYAYSPGLSPITEQGSIVTTHVDSSTVVNTTYINDLSTHAGGHVMYDTLDLFFTGGQTGIYEQALYKGATLIDTSYFIYITSSSTISLNKATYYVNDSVYATYSTDSSYSLDDYDISIAFYTESGGFVTSTPVNEISGIEHIQLESSDFSTGVYYSVLIATAKVGGSTYYLAYDVIRVSSAPDTFELTGGTAYTFQDDQTYSNYFSTTVTKSATGIPWFTYTLSKGVTSRTYNDRFVARTDFFMKSDNIGVHDTVTCKINDVESSFFTYYAFTWCSGTLSRYGGGANITGYFRGEFYSSTSTIVGTTGDLTSYVTTYNSNDRWEFFRYGTTMYTYANGVLINTKGGVSGDSYKFSLVCGQHSSERTTIDWDIYIDDVERKSPYGGGVISTIPQDWYIYKDIADPALSGIKCSTNDTMMSGDLFSTSYAIGSNMDGYTSGMTITTEHLSTSTVVNTTTKTTAEVATDPAGIIRYSSKNMLINASAPYGVYKQTLKHGTQTIAYTTFAYISGGGTIYWDRDEYNAGDVADVTSSIGSSFDPATYDYYGRIYDIYGQIKHSWTITHASDVEQITVDPDTYSNGLYYANLIAVRKTDSEEFVMAYDVAEITESVIANGYTWDAVDETKLGSVDVGVKQFDDWVNTTSDVTTAFYQVSTLISNAELMFNASKTGYNHTPIHFTPLTAKTYNIDLYLLPVPIPFNGSGIGGLVLTNSYKQAIEGATVTLSNDTWSSSKTTSSTGWYLFDSTEIPSPSGGYELSDIDVVDNTSDMGMYSSITANGSMIHIAYHDNTNDEAISAYKDTSWHTTVVDNGTVTTFDDCVYVADTGNSRIVQRDENLIYLNKIGSEGTGNDEFNSSVGITTLRNYTTLSNYVYIADTENHRVVKRFANNLTYVSSFGSYGNGTDNFSSPQDVCLDGEGVYMWVADTGNHRIVQRFAGNYTYVNQYGSYGTGTTNFSSPQGVGTEASGTYLLVTDTGNHRVMKFFAQNLTYIDSVGSLGSNLNQFSSPRSSTIERNGDDVFYVADTGNNRIVARKLSDLTHIRRIGSLGPGIDQFNAPKDVTTDGVYIYVADSGNNRIHKRYASDLTYVSMIGSSGSGDDQFSTPSGITASLNGSATVDYNVGEYMSSTIDSTGNEWVSYYDASNADLMVAIRNYDGYWHTHRVDTTADVGKYTGIANYDGGFRVSYYNVTGQTLKYAYGDETGYLTETADDTTGVGTYSSIVLTDGGEPRIAYYDATNGDLRYAYKDIFGWHNSSIDTLENVGLYTDIDIDDSGYCYISYYDSTNANLKYAYRDSTGWNTVVVDSVGDVGKYTSIVRSDTTGYVYISYYDATNADLKMAYHNTTGWSIVTVDSTGDVGRYSSITLDGSGYPHISYYDATNQQLKHAYYYLATTTTNNLAPLTTYTITASKTGYITNTSSVVAPTYGNFTLHHIFMSGYYNLTVNIKNAKSNTLMTEGVSVTLSDGQTLNTTSGQVTFNAVYGSYTVSAACDGYYQTSSAVLLDADKEVTLYMTEMPDYTSAIDYTMAPRNVRFVCVDHFGQRLEGIDVSAVGYQTTLPDWGILNVVFGWMIEYTNSSVTNETMAGTTGDDGSIVFLMTEVLQYRMTFTDSTRGINDTLVLYPKDDTYVINLGTTPFAAPDTQHINITMYTSEPNSSATTLWAYYNDPNFHTTSANFTVRNATGYVIYSHVTSGSNAFTDSYTVSHVTGKQYTWGIRAQQTDYGTVSRYSTTTLHSRLIELGLEDMYYNWISIIFLFILIGLFSGRSVIYGYVVFPLVAGIFWFIGWLDVSYILISGVIILGIMLFLSKKQFQGEGI